jgi:hypothetical protein
LGTAHVLNKNLKVILWQFERNVAQQTGLPWLRRNFQSVRVAARAERV